MSQYSFLLLFFALMLSSPGLRAQEDAVSLTLENAIAIALEESYDARMFRLELIEAEQDVKAAKGRFKTNVRFSMDSPNFQEQVQDIRLPDEVPQYNTVGTTRWNGQMVISQPLPTNGSINLRSDLRQIHESVFRDQLDTRVKDRRFYTSMRLEMRQPLFIPNTLNLQVERANLNYELAQKQYTQTQLDVIYQVTQEFYNLYRAKRGLEIARENLKQLEDEFELARKKFEAGLIPEVEALQTEVDLAQGRNDLLEAEGTLSRSADQLKLAIGLPLGNAVTVETDFALSFFAVDEEQAIAHGLKNRAEIRQTEIERRLAEIMVKQTDAQSAIRGDVSAYYDLTGVSDPFLPYGTGTQELFRSSLTDLESRPHNRGITFTLSIPLWDSGVNKAEVAAARAQLDRRGLTETEQKRMVEQEIRSVITRLRETKGRLEALQKSESVALRGYEISRARFDNGDITSQQLALDRERLTQARQNYLNAYIQYQLAVADLKRQTLYDWESNRSLVE